MSPVIYLMTVAWLWRRWDEQWGDRSTDESAGSTKKQLKNLESAWEMSACWRLEYRFLKGLGGDGKMCGFK